MAKRILIYTNHYFPEQFKINDVVNWLNEENYDIRVVTGFPNYPSGKIYKGYGLFSKISSKVTDTLIINRLPLIPRGSGSNLMLAINYFSYFISSMLFTFYLIMFKKKYEVVLVHHTSPFLVSIPPIFYKLFKSSKNILWDLDIWPQTLVAMGIIKNKKIINLIDYTVKLIYKSYDKILVSSKSLKEYLISRTTENKIDFFPNWADEGIELSDLDEVEQMLDSNYLNIMYIGNIGKAQDFGSLIKGLEILNNEKLRFYFIGGGRFKRRFQSIIKSKRFSSKIIFIDHQKINKISSYAKQADVLFLSLKNEKIFNKTLPAKLTMYMSIGKPILAMISGEANNLINKSKIGIAVDSGDYTNLANKILDLINDKYNIVEMGHNAKKLYESEFNSGLRKKQIIKLIELI